MPSNPQFTARWISKLEVAELLEIHYPASVDKLIKQGLIGCRKYPGLWPRYDRHDVEALLRRATVPARVLVEA